MFFNRKRPPVFLPVQLLMSRSLCQRCAVMSGAEWFCLLPAGLVVPQWYHGWAKGILQPSAHRALAGSWSDKTPSFPLLRDYWDTEFFLGANGSSSRSMPCISLCMEELSCHLGPRAQHDTMSQHYSNHAGLVSTASVWIINAELCVLETLQQWYQWLFRVGDIGGVVFNLFLAHMSLLFSVVVEIASLWTILQQQTSKVSELETNCIVDYFFFSDLHSSGDETRFLLLPFPGAWGSNYQITNPIWGRVSSQHTVQPYQSLQYHPISSGPQFDGFEVK